MLIEPKNLKELLEGLKEAIEMGEEAPESEYLKGMADEAKEILPRFDCESAKMDLDCNGEFYGAWDCDDWDGFKKSLKKEEEELLENAIPEAGGKSEARYLKGKVHVIRATIEFMHALNMLQRGYAFSI